MGQETKTLPAAQSVGSMTKPAVSQPTFGKAAPVPASAVAASPARFEDSAAFNGGNFTGDQLRSWYNQNPETPLPNWSQGNDPFAGFTRTPAPAASQTVNPTGMPPPVSDPASSAILPERFSEPSTGAKPQQMPTPPGSATPVKTGSYKSIQQDVATTPPAQQSIFEQAARATAQGNQDSARIATEANRVNQVTPYGNLTYTRDPNNPNGWTSTVSLAPDQQKLLDASNQSQLGLAGLQGNALEQVKNTMSQPMSTKGVTPLQGSVPSGQFQTALNGMNNGQGSISMNGVDQVDNKNIPNPDEAYRQKYQDAVYGQQAQYMDTRWEQDKSAFDAQMANQGLVPGGEAYDNAYRNFADSKQRAYSDAQMQAITGGLTAQQAQFGMGLQSNQQRNANQAQQFGQSAAQTTAANQGAQIQNANALAQGQFANQAEGQRFDQGLASATLGNSANQLGMQNQSFLYNQPLNTLNALRTGSQVQNPSFINVPQQGQTAGADIMGATQAQYNDALSRQNASTASKNTFMNGLFGLGNAWLGG